MHFDDEGQGRGHEENRQASRDALRGVAPWAITVAIGLWTAFVLLAR